MREERTIINRRDVPRQLVAGSVGGILPASFTVVAPVAPVEFHGMDMGDGALS